MKTNKRKRCRCTYLGAQLKCIVNNKNGEKHHNEQPKQRQSKKCLYAALIPFISGFPAVYFQTRRILDILYSAQHGNQHKDALA